MIRKCVKTDLGEMIDLAYELNNIQEHYSAFCSCTRENIKADFANGIETGESIYIGNFENGILTGFIGGYIDEERKNVDCSGPYIANYDISISEQLLSALKQEFAEEYKFTFYFGSMNTELISLMKSENAEFAGNEYKMKIKENGFQYNGAEEDITELPAEMHEQFIQLHDNIFPGVYISGKGIIETLGKTRHVFALSADKKLVGYCVLKTYDDRHKGTIEVLAIRDEYRHQGYGRKLLISTIGYTFHKFDISELDLIVEQINTNALALYYSAGFKLVQENIAYIV